MKRTLTIIFGVLALAGIIVAALPLLVSTNAVRERITNHLSDLTGREVTFRGDPSVSFSPFLGIEVSDFSVADPLSADNAKPLLAIEKINAKLDWLPALVGRVKISEYTLLRPKLSLWTGGDGKSNWHLTTGALKDAFDSQKAALANNEDRAAFATDLGSFTIIDGSVSYTNDIDSSNTTVTNLNANVTWPRTDDRFILAGQAIWKNENLSLNADITSPLSLMAGGESAISMNLNSEPINFAFEGTANLIADLFAKGSVTATTPSIARFSDFAEIDLGPVNILGEWKATGQLDLTPNTTLLTDAIIEVNGKPGEGVVRLARNEVGKVKLDGTLAFGEIKLPPGLLSFKTLLEFNSEQFRTGDLDVDLRVSSNRIASDDVVLEAVAAAINVSDEQWILDIGDAQAFNGSLISKLTYLPKAETPKLNLKLTANDASITALSNIVQEEEPIISGTGNVNLDLRITPANENEGSALINGSMELLANSGNLNLIEFPVAFSKASELETNGTIEPTPTGSTGFETLELKVFLSNNIASIGKAELITSGDDIALFGDVDLVDSTLKLAAQEVREGTPGSYRLLISGTLDEPTLAVKKNPQTLNN